MSLIYCPADAADNVFASRRGRKGMGGRRGLVGGEAGQVGETRRGGDR